MPGIIKGALLATGKRISPLKEPFYVNQFIALTGKPVRGLISEEFRFALPGTLDLTTEGLTEPQVSTDLVPIEEIGVDLVAFSEWEKDKDELKAETSSVDCVLAEPEVHDITDYWVDIEVTENLFIPLGKAKVDGRTKRREVEKPEPGAKMLEWLESRKEKDEDKEVAADRRTRPESDKDSLDFWEAIIFPLLEPPLNFDFPQYFLPTNLELYPFQKEGIIHLAKNQHFLLADTMGLGKTIQVIMALRILFQQGKIKNALIICPRSIVRQWGREFDKWANALHVETVYGSHDRRQASWRKNKHVYITTYDSLKRDCGNESCPEGRLSFDLVVSDECQRIKNPESERSKCVTRLPCTWRWGMSGTPVENDKNDIVGIFGFIKPGLLDDYMPEETIQNNIKPYFLRRRAEDVLDEFPELISHDYEVDLTESQRRKHDSFYDSAKKKLVALGDKATRQHVFSLLTTLKQICNFDPDSLEGSIVESSKAEWLKENLEGPLESGAKALVFSNFIPFGVNPLSRYLAKYKPLVITGSTSDSARERIVERFESEGSDSRLLIASLQTMKEGINLPSASYVFHFDHWWNPAVHDQATHRARRISSVHKHVFEYHIWTRDSIEDKIKIILDRKKDLFRRLIDDQTKITVDKISEEELFGLFDLEAPSAKRKKASSDLSQLSPEEFEKKVGDFFRKSGYRVKITGRSHDGGIDIELRRPSFSGEERVIVQCKRYSGSVGVGFVRELLGVISADKSITKGFLVTTSYFTKEAERLAADNGGIELIDGQNLKTLMDRN